MLSTISLVKKERIFVITFFILNSILVCVVFVGPWLHVAWNTGYNSSALNGVVGGIYSALVSL